jgi:hypothetical protein
VYHDELIELISISKKGYGCKWTGETKTE